MNRHLIDLLLTAASLAGIMSHARVDNETDARGVAKVAAMTGKATAAAISVDLEPTEEERETADKIRALEAELREAREERLSDLAEIGRRLGGNEGEPTFAIVDRVAAKLRAPPPAAEPPAAASVSPEAPPIAKPAADAPEVPHKAAAGHPPAHVDGKRKP